jgi:hypothetical protein
METISSHEKMNFRLSLRRGQSSLEAQVWSLLWPVASLPQSYSHLLKSMSNPRKWNERPSAQNRARVSQTRRLVRRLIEVRN